MTAPLQERLRAACKGHPHAKIAWPHRLLHEAADRLDALEAAGQAVVDRWDTPLWKDVPATAEYINALRAALAHAQRGEG